MTTTNLSVSVGFAAATGRPQTLAWCMYLMYPVIAADACGRSLLLAGQVFALPLLVAAGWHFAGVVPIGESIGPALLVAVAAEAAYLSAASAHESVRASRQERDRLVREAAIAEVRRRTARELHTTLGAALTETALWLGVATATAGAEAQAADRRAREGAREATAGLRACLGSFASPQVAPGALERVLRTRLQGLCEAAGAALRFEFEAAVAALSAERAWHLTQFIEEAVVNAVRHGNPREVEVCLRVGEGLRVEVRDDGVGFHPSKTVRGLGLTALGEHAAALGGAPVIDSVPGKGTRVALGSEDASKNPSSEDRSTRA